jgi:hypothetical protein
MNKQPTTVASKPSSGSSNSNKTTSSSRLDLTDIELGNLNISEEEKHALLIKNAEAFLSKNINKSDELNTSSRKTSKDTSNSNASRSMPDHQSHPSHHHSYPHQNHPNFFYARSAIDANNINNMFNAYSTRKTFATGLLDLALIATNFTQMKQVIQAKQDSPWQPIDIVIIFAICLSIILQFICGVILLFSAKQEFLDEYEIDEIMQRNNSITVLVLAITIVNIFINVFLNL